MEEKDSRLVYSWESFMNCEELSKKEEKFDTFLTEFFNSLMEPILVDVPDLGLFGKCTPLKIADSVAKEFIFEVHNACTRSDDNDELAPLVNYLLKGRGWKCLALLQQFKNVSLPTAYELSHLLISLYALVDYDDCLDCNETNPFLGILDRISIDAHIHNKLDSVLEKQQGVSIKKYNKEVRKSNIESARPVEEIEKNLSSLSGMWSNYTVKLVPLPKFLFPLYPCVEEELSKTTNVADLCLNVDGKSNMEVNSGEFRLLILNILLNFCNTNRNITDEHDELIGTIIKFSLENLCTLQYHFSKRNTSMIEKIKCNLTYLLITCADNTIQCKKVMESLIQNGIIQIFLQLLQDVTRYSPIDGRSNYEENTINFLYSMCYCILLLFLQILRGEHILKHLTLYNKLYRQFLGCNNGRLFENIIKTLIIFSDGPLGLKRSKILATFLGLITVRFKIIKRYLGKYDEMNKNFGNITAMKKNLTTSLSGHHDHIFGEPFKSVILSPASLHKNCCIASTSVILFRIALENSNDELTASIYRILMYCGTCCCVPVGWFLTKILRNLSLQKYETKKLILAFLERKFYPDTGLFKNKICENCTISGTIDVCQTFSEFKILLLKEDPEIVQCTGKHILKAFNNLTPDAQEYIVVKIFSDIFDNISKEINSYKNCSHKDSVLICLAAFGDATIYNQFSTYLDEILPTNSIRNLLCYEYFVEPCCQILETRILFKTSQFEREGNQFTPVLANSCTSELNLFLSLFSECCDEIGSLDFINETVEGLKPACKNLLRMRIIIFSFERLITCNNAIKSFLRAHVIKNKFHELLFSCLGILSKEDFVLGTNSQNSSIDIQFQFVRPLLIICLHLSNDAKGMEKQVKDLIHKSLQSGNISIIQLCESLLSIQHDELEHSNVMDSIYTDFNGMGENLEQSDYNSNDIILSWSRAELAMSQISFDNDNEIVSLLDAYSKSSLLYPMVCTIAVDLINALQIDKYTQEALYVLHHICTICQRNSDICSLLRSQNMVSKLMDKLEESLKEELLSPEEADVQYAITQFLSILFHYKIDSNELIRFFNLFKVPSAPYDLLVHTLSAIVDNATKVIQPTNYLSFPAKTSKYSDSEFDEPAETLAITMRDLYKSVPMNDSPWIVCGITLPLNISLGWSIWLTGISVSFWFKLDFPSGVALNEECCDDNNSSNFFDTALHVLSIGYDTMLLEIWINNETSCFMARLTRPLNNYFEVLSQVCFQKSLNVGEWHNIAINVKDTMQQQKVALELTLNIDGFYEEIQYLIFTGLFMRKVRPACLMLGDVRTSLKSRYQLGNFMMFRTAVINKDCSLIIRALGPDLENVVSCLANSFIPNFTNLLGNQYNYIPADFCISRLQKSFEENMKKMQENILISYTPRTAEYFFHYVNSDVMNAVSGMFPSTATSTPTLFRRSKMQRNNQRLPHPGKVILFCSPKSVKVKLLFDCIQEVGGFSFLAFLFAKVVNSCQLESTQCDILKLILKSSLCDIRIFTQFSIFKGYNLISKVIKSPLSCLRQTAFVALTNFLCSEKNYFVLPESEMRVNVNVHIVNTDILTSLLLPNWKYWESHDEELLVNLFKGLQAMISSSNNYKEMNTRLLASADVVEKTLNIYKERFILEDTSYKNNNLCLSVLEFIKSMIGSPPSIDHIKSIIDYLYVVHPTSHSFCNNSASGFYFLFSSLSQHTKKVKDSQLNSVIMNPLQEQDIELEQDAHQHEYENQPSEEMNTQNFFAFKNIHNSSNSDDDDESKGKTVDSGILSVSTVDTLHCSLGSNLNLCNKDSEQDVGKQNSPAVDVLKYSSLQLSNTQQLLLEKRWKKNKKEDDCEQDIITVGLLNIVNDTMLAHSGTPIANVFNSVVDPKLLIILANHPNMSVRNCVVQTIVTWLIRCEDENVAAVKFSSQLKGFYHLANQLAMYPATEQIVNSCISLMSRCHWDAIGQIDEIDEITLPTLHYSALPPLLAVFPGTIHDTKLCSNLIRFFKILISSAPHALNKLMDHGFIESLVKAILLIIHDTSYVSTNCNALFDEIVQLFTLIMSTCIQSPGVLYLQMLNDIVYKLRYLEVTEEALCGIEEECVKIIHNLHCKVLRAGLDTTLMLIDLYHSRDNIKGRHSPSFLSSMAGSMSASLSSIPSSIRSFKSSNTNTKQKLFPKGEMIDRYKLIINRATEYLQFSSSSMVTEKDVEFARYLLYVLINGVASIVQKSYFSIGSPWSTVYWSARDTLRTQASNLLIWMLAPLRPIHLRMHVIQTLLHESKTKEILSNLIFINAENEQRFILFLWHLMYCKSSDLSVSDIELCEEFKNALLQCGIISSQAIGQANDRWQYEVTSALRELSVLYWGLEKAQQDTVYKYVYKMENLSKILSDSASSISSVVVDRQGNERKKLLADMKNKFRMNVDARNRWRHILQQMTHELAPWYHPEMYPNSWEMDPTEGPDRVRKRLRRCKLNIKKKFFKPEFIADSDPEDDYPLAYLFENSDSQSLFTAALDCLSVDDTISFMCSATNVVPSAEVIGELLIGKGCLYFIPTRIGNSSVSICEADKYSIIAKFEDIQEIHNRRFQLKERAIELFFSNGKTSLIAFTTPLDRNKFIKALGEHPLPNKITNDVLLVDAVEKWRESQITNWEYLKTLNKMSGRSYNDLMQYPIMPFILCDYQSDCIDLREMDIYRNLRKPMAIQDKKKEGHFINHYNYLKNESILLPDAAVSLKQTPYHYSSHYSNSGTVLHFLVRMPPFTQIFLEYQDNNFDLPDRTFHSLETTWRLASSESTTDVKELIPEFFSFPEFLLNSQGFNFGLKQNGETVNDVKLPKWSHQDPRLFILVHRQMLESEYVKENLPHWIDLVFGFKQTGKAAVDAINVFHPATYYGFDVDSIPDELEKAAWETMVKTYGQTPRLLFKNAHPMVIQYLMSNEDENIPVIKGVKGLRWGNYVGSPSKSSPSIVWNHFYPSIVSSLIPLVTNDVFGLPKNSVLLLSYTMDRTVNLVNEGITVLGAAVLSWTSYDGIIRIKERKEQPPIPAIFCPPQDPISVCSTAPDCPFIWIGFESGNILVFRYSFSASNSGVEIQREPFSLVGHKSKVNNICISKSFGVAVSVSDDERAIIWDLNEIIYIRSLPSSNWPLSYVAISDTLGDIATVCDLKETNSSILRLHTINAALVGRVELNERITSLCFSRAPEGISVNVIAVGLNDGVIRLWSSWDLSPVTDIINTSINGAIIGLTYSYDSQHLYASVSDGNVYIWEATTSSSATKTPKFLNLTAVN